MVLLNLYMKIAPWDELFTKSQSSTLICSWFITGVLCLLTPRITPVINHMEMGTAIWPISFPNLNCLLCQTVDFLQPFV